MGRSIEETVDEVREGCNEGYCFLREMLSKRIRDLPKSSGCFKDPSRCCLRSFAIGYFASMSRELVQFKCVEKFRWEEGERLKRPVTWNEASLLWCDHYAKSFSEKYSPDLSAETIYHLVVGENSKRIAA